jgi:hypothetical protein
MPSSDRESSLHVHTPRHRRMQAMPTYLAETLTSPGRNRIDRLREKRMDSVGEKAASIKNDSTTWAKWQRQGAAVRVIGRHHEEEKRANPKEATRRNNTLHRTS